jgi:acyl-CoA dehydrogenase
MILLNPKKDSFGHLDTDSQILIKKTVDWFEKRGKAQLKQDDYDRAWHTDFLEFVREEKLFSTFLTPGNAGSSQTRWDTYRNCQLNEILGFYGITFWYVWQVSILGLGPIWMSHNEKIKNKVAQLLDEGGIFAFGLSEKEHGADIYSSSMRLIPQDNMKYLAKGEKYYIGNANKAAMVSTFGKLSDSEDYVFFVVDPKHEKYDCVKNTVNSRNYVAEFHLNDYPISEEDIIHRGPKAWDAALNTINVGKFNLGWASIGICTHAFYEAINHASKRKLFGHFVTEFPHIEDLFVSAYSRILAMKMFALRGADYMRAGSKEDRRYLLYVPMVKMKVTTEGEEVINNLWDVIAAKGFEKDTFFEIAARDIRALPKLEGTVHVNMALIIKFMKNYFFHPASFSEVPKMDQTQNDDFLFDQGPTKGLGEIHFHDYTKVYDSIDLPNISIFKKQIKTLKIFLTLASPDKDQIKDFDFLLNLGQLFTLVVYGQLIIENAQILKIDNKLIDQIFDFMIKDFSKYALNLYSKDTSTLKQRLLCLKMIQKPNVNKDRFNYVLQKYVYDLADKYEMNN